MHPSDSSDLMPQILAELKKISSLLSANELGPQKTTGLTCVYCNRQHKFNWYTLNADRQPVEFPYVAIAGWLEEIAFPKVERRGKEEIKLHITLRCPQGLYRLESGYDSHFAKCFLAAIAELPPEILKQPITIVPSPGDDEAVLFCRVSSEGVRVEASYSDQSDWKAIAKTAIRNLKESRN